jgi:DNA-binding response OmpR family regulator
MPLLDAWEATPAMKVHPRTRHIPVVVLTGHVTPENLERAGEEGARAVLTKPCRPAELLLIVQPILQRERRRSGDLRLRGVREIRSRVRVDRSTLGSAGEEAG